MPNCHFFWLSCLHFELVFRHWWWLTNVQATENSIKFSLVMARWGLVDDCSCNKEKGQQLETYQCDIWTLLSRLVICMDNIIPCDMLYPHVWHSHVSIACKSWPTLTLFLAFFLAKAKPPLSCITERVECFFIIYIDSSCFWPLFTKVLGHIFLFYYLR